MGIEDEIALSIGGAKIILVLYETREGRGGYLKTKSSEVACRLGEEIKGKVEDSKIILKIQTEESLSDFGQKIRQKLAAEPV